MIFADPLLPVSLQTNEENTVYIDDDAMLQGGTTQQNISKRLKERLAIKEAIATPLGIKFAPEKADLIYLLPTTSKLPPPTATVPLYQEPITPKEVIKILGVYIDQKCTFREQASKAASRAITITAMIRNLTRNQNITPATVFKLVQSLLIPAMLWGSEIWWTGADHIVRRISSAYHRAARLITGLPNHTPIEAMLSEAGLPTLNKLLDSKSIGYGVHTLLSPDSNRVKSELIRLLNQPNKSTGFGLERIAYLLQNTVNNLPIENPTDITQPWISPTSTYIALLDKETESIAHQKWVKNHPEIYRVYTDGSKEESVSAAWVSIVNNTIHNKEHLNIGRHQDILDGELTAIHAALHHLKQIELTNTPVWLCVDNQLAIKRLTGEKAPAAEVVQKILLLTQQLQNKGCSISIRWTPSHVGIKGNDLADGLAREGLLHPCSKETVSLTWLKGLSYRIKNEGLPNRGPTPHLATVNRRTASIMWRVRNSVTQLDPSHFHTPTKCECGEDISRGTA